MPCDFYIEEDAEQQCRSCHDHAVGPTMWIVGAACMHKAEATQSRVMIDACAYDRSHECIEKVMCEVMGAS